MGKVRFVTGSEGESFAADSAFPGHPSLLLVPLPSSLSQFYLMAQFIPGLGGLRGSCSQLGSPSQTLTIDDFLRISKLFP